MYGNMLVEWIACIAYVIFSIKKNMTYKNNFVNHEWSIIKPKFLLLIIL